MESFSEKCVGGRALKILRLSVWWVDDEGGGGRARGRAKGRF